MCAVILCPIMIFIHIFLLFLLSYVVVIALLVYNLAKSNEVFAVITQNFYHLARLFSDPSDTNFG